MIKKEMSELEKYLKDEPKVRIKIPIDPLNKHITSVPVILNGYSMNVPKGETVDVPQSVADILEGANYI